MDYTRLLKAAIIITITALLIILGWINIEWIKYVTFGILIITFFISFFYMFFKLTNLKNENQHYKIYCYHPNNIIKKDKALTPQKRQIQKRRHIPCKPKK